MGDSTGLGGPKICFSIDVERDYRLDGRMTTRGIEEGLPSYLDQLRSLGVPYDLFISGEVVGQIPIMTLGDGHGLRALGCHALTHETGPRSYLSRKSRSALEFELRTATDRVTERFGQRPIHFRAPNFSTSRDTLSVLEELGYRSDSSVLPGRFVRRWKVVPILDHRRAPRDPYHPSRTSPIVEGDFPILEIPVTSNPLIEGSPLGLGFVHGSGSEIAFRALASVTNQYAIILAHSWEMVSWTSSDPVATWVRRSSSSSTRGLQELLEKVNRDRFVNMNQILNEQTT